MNRAVKIVNSLHIATWLRLINRLLSKKTCLRKLIRCIVQNAADTECTAMRNHTMYCLKVHVYVRKPHEMTRAGECNMPEREAVRKGRGGKHARGASKHEEPRRTAFHFSHWAVSVWAFAGFLFLYFIHIIKHCSTDTQYVTISELYRNYGFTYLEY